MSTPELSIVLPTCDRAGLLGRALETIARTVRVAHEVVVVDGASGDDTPGVLERARGWMGDRLRVIREDRREGFVTAANKGFRAATGRNVVWLNDDVRPLPRALDSAVAQLDSEPADVAFVALFHHWHSPRNVAYELVMPGRAAYQLCHVRGTLYANFPVGRRATFERLGYFDERYYFFAADPDLSLKAWHAGMRVVPAYGAAVEHDEVADARREGDAGRGAEDNRRLFEKWDLPPKNVHCNDFDPARPCTVRGLKEEDRGDPGRRLGQSPGDSAPACCAIEVEGAGARANRMRGRLSGPHVRALLRRAAVMALAG